MPLPPAALTIINVMFRCFMKSLVGTIVFISGFEMIHASIDFDAKTSIVVEQRLFSLFKSKCQDNPNPQCLKESGARDEIQQLCGHLSDEGRKSCLNVAESLVAKILSNPNTLLRNDFSDELLTELEKGLLKIVKSQCQSDPSAECIKNSGAAAELKRVCGHLSKEGKSNCSISAQMFLTKLLNDLRSGKETLYFTNDPEELNSQIQEARRIELEQAQKLAELAEQSQRIAEERRAIQERTHQDNLEAVRLRQEAEAQAKWLEELDKRKAREEREAFLSRTGVQGVLVDLFIALSLLISFFVVNLEYTLNRLKGVRVDKT
jgi:hypothetical protein